MSFVVISSWDFDACFVPVAIRFRVSTTMFPVNQFSFSDASNEPFFLIIPSTSMPCSLAVALSSSWKSESLTPDFSTCFESLFQELMSVLFTWSDLRKKLLRTSSIAPIILLNISDKEVHNCLPCSKSPQMISQVWAQPDWAASLSVSIIMLNVFTSCADAYAFLPMSVVSSAYILRVDTRTSVVIHCSCRVSLKLWVAFNVFPVNVWYIPSDRWINVPIATALSISCCLNSTVAMLAFSIDFQSISFT